MLSVVIPAYNEEKYLPRCLQSLREQDYPGAYEVIVVDNGSTDGTAEVARSFGGRVVFCPQKGVVYAREAGARAAQGEIIVQCDADNILPRDWLSRIAQHFASHPQDVALSGDVTYLGEPLWHRLPHLSKRWCNISSHLVLKYPLSPLAGNFAVRRQALEAVGGYDLALPYSGDEWDFVSKLKRVGHVAYDPSLTVATSARRFQGRFWPAIFVDYLYHVQMGRLFVHWTGRPQMARRHDIRAERRLTVSWPEALRIGIPLLLVAVLLYGFFFPSAQVYGKVYSQKHTSQKVIALTFDDGPNDPYTSQILDILAQYEVKATFFVVGKNVENNPKTTRRILAEGHVLGNHSWSHRRLEPVVGLWDDELERTQQTIEWASGVRPRLFRPPYGQKTPWQLAQLSRNKIIVVTWDVSVHDPRQPPASVIAQIAIKRAHPGAIVLLHDGKETAQGADRSRTVAALPEIVETLLERGYTFVTLPELLEVPAYLPEKMD